MTGEVQLSALMTGLTADGPFPVPRGRWNLHLWRDATRSHLSREGAMLPGEDDDDDYSYTGHDFPGEAVGIWVVQFAPRP